jgi:predicted phosphodiesterase
LTTVAVIADTHLPRGSRRLPEECVEQIRAADLAAMTPRLVAVHGNVDDAELRRRVPETVELEVADAVIAVVHDAGPARGRLGRMRRLFPSAAAVVFGHSHMPLLERDDDGFQIFNPGSPTERRRAPVRTMGVARVSRKRVEFEHIELR